MSVSTSFDFAPLLPPGLPAPAAKWTGLAKYSFVGGNNDPEQVPVDGLLDAVNAVLKREGKNLATYGLASGPQGYRPLREFLCGKLKRDAAIAATPDDILIVSGSLQALDLVNQTLLARGDTVIVEQETYQGSLNRLTRLGVNTIGIPLDAEGMRMDALARTLGDLKAGGIRPKYIYTIPTVQNPTGTIMPEQRRAELLRLSQEYGVPIFEDDCYADLIWDGQRPPAIYAMAGNGGVIHIGSFSKSIAPALRVGFIVAPWAMLSRMLALKTDAGSGALEQMVLAEYCAPHFATHVPKLTRGHLPLGEAARQRRYAEALPGGARRRRRHQSRTGMVDQQGVFRLPLAALFRESFRAADSRGRRRARRRLPQGVRRPAPHRQCGEAGVTPRNPI
jgi:2-aminoadipate transaminase